MKITTNLILVACLSLLSTNLVQSATVTEDLKRSARWNKFVDNIYEFHQQRVANRDVYTKEEDGGYGGITNDMEFYREIRYYDKKTDRLLSNIKWENKNPDNLHVIELFVYDEQGRIEREYIAAYLPVHRKAPFQTLVNLHNYDDELHGYRQFDASNNLVFEFCSGRFLDEKIHIVLDDYEIPDSVSQIRDDMTREAYRACFDALPKTALPYLNPLTVSG